jgi:hypothetical protein
VLVAAASLAFGPKVWVAYVNDAMPAQTALIARDFEHFMVHMPTVFMNARVAGAPMSVAIWAQVLVSATALVAVVWTFWRRREPDLSNMLFVTATFLATPYAFNYDMVVFGWVAIKLMERSDADAWDYLLMLAVWATPFMTVPSGMAGFPVSVLPMLAFGGRLIWRIWQAEQQCGGRTKNNRGAGARGPADRPPVGRDLSCWANSSGYGPERSACPRSDAAGRGPWLRDPRPGIPAVPEWSCA